METVGQVLCTSPHPFYHQQSAENSFYYQFPERPQENWWRSYESEEESISTNEDDDVLERFLKELDVKGHQMINKLVSKLENNVPFEQVFRETCHHFRGKSASHILEKIGRKVERKRGFERRERGLDGDILEGELKNERFKVKTMNVIGSGVVKEEDRHE